MIRTPLARLAAVLALVGAIAIPIASASAKSSGTKVSLHKTSMGMILVNAKGNTLYAFTKDSKNKDRCITTAGCTGVWPAVKTNGKPVAGKGVKAGKLGSITLSNGSHQVTYAGHPLYTYIGDDPGDTEYVGAVSFGGTWVAVTAAGKTVK